MEDTYAVVILGGGKSGRMNFPKLFLDISGKTFLQKLTDTYYDAGIKNICAVINQEYCEGVWKNKINKITPFVSELITTNSIHGRFHSLKIGISKLLSYDFVFIQNADNPFIGKEVIKRLQKNRYASGYTQPFYRGRKGHPILISKKVSQHIDSIAGDEHDLRAVLREFPKIDVEIDDEKILANINTKQDYEQYFSAYA